MATNDLVSIVQPELSECFPDDSLIPPSPCEMCGKHLRDHDWVGVDRQGFVQTCSNKPIA